MTYGKLENGYIRYAPKTVTWQGHIVNNPDSEKLKELGYLPIRYVDMPTDAPEGKHYESSWEQTETEIVQTWTLVEDEPVPEPPPTIEEQIAALQRALISQKIVGGGTVNITDSSENKVKDVKIFGKSEQTQDPPPSPDNPQPIRNVGKYNEETGKYEVDVVISDGTESGRKQTITLSLDQPLRECEEYRDEVTKDGIVRNIYSHSIKGGMITGNEYNWNTKYFRYFVKPETSVECSINRKPMCTISKTMKIYKGIDLFYWVIGENEIKSIGVTPEDSAKVAIEKIRGFIDENEVIIQYIMKMPVIEPLPADFKKALESLSTYYPTTVVTVDGGEVYGGVEVTYTADTKNYIDNQIKAVTGKQIETNKLMLERMI